MRALLALDGGTGARGHSVVWAGAVLSRPVHTAAAVVVLRSGVLAGDPVTGVGGGMVCVCEGGGGAGQANILDHWGERAYDQASGVGGIFGADVSEEVCCKARLGN